MECNFFDKLPKHFLGFSLNLCKRYANVPALANDSRMFFVFNSADPRSFPFTEKLCKSCKNCKPMHHRKICTVIWTIIPYQDKINQKAPTKGNSKRNMKYRRL